ncbi:unnamed protein product, partial [marine sediment metagenome]
LVECNNVRIQEGGVKNTNLGWTRMGGFADDDMGPLNGSVLISDEFRQRDQSSVLILGTPLDLYAYSDVSSNYVFITPIYNTGTCDVTDASPVIDMNTGFTEDDDISVGDFINIGADDENDPAAIWLEIVSLDDVAETVTIEDDIGGTANNLPFTVRRVFSGTSADIWCADTFPNAQPDNEDLWIATNGLVVVKWNGSDDTCTVLSLGFSCRYLKYWKNMMIYADITESGEYKPSSIRNSAFAEPEDVTDDEADEFAIGNGTDPISRVEDL